jgi:beta-lactamase class D
MARTHLQELAVIALLLAGAPALAEDAELAKLFARHGVVGTLVLAPLEGSRAALVHNAARARQRFVPASTFKVPNSLIALEEGAIDERQLMRWDGKDRGRPEWNRDHTLASAFRVSCVWCYQLLARRVGLDRYRKHLARLRYGNAAPGADVQLFWLDGSLRVSALEQIELLRGIANRTFPFKAAAYDALARVMVLEKGPRHVLRAKTGWSKESKPELGWLVGEVSAEGRRWVFALNLDLRSDADAPKRLQIVREALRAKRIIREPR